MYTVDVKADLCRHARGLGLIHRVCLLFHHLVAVLRSHYGLPVVVVIFVGLATADNLLLPPFESDMEHRHYAYVRHLAQGRGLPPLGVALTEYSPFQEAGQPPLYYTLAALVTAWVPGADNVDAALYHNPDFAFEGPNSRPDNENYWLRSPRVGEIDPGFLLALHLARAVSTCFGVVTIVSTYGLGLALFDGDQRSASFGAAWVALNPQLAYICGVTSNDSAAVAMAALVLWIMAKWVVRGPSLRSAIVFGGALGLAALSKVSVLGIFPICVVGFWLGVRRRPLRRAMGYAVWTVGLMLLVAGWWYVRGAILYGDPLGLSLHIANSELVRRQPPSLLRQLTWVWKIDWSYWAAFGWGMVLPPTWVLGTAVWWGRISLFGVGPYMWREWPKLGQRRSLLALLVAWFLLCMMAVLWWLRAFPLALGRLLLPAASALGVLMVVGWHGWLPARWQQVGLWAITAGLLAFALACPYAVIRPAFARPPQLSVEQRAELSHGPTLVFDHAARLLAAEVDPRPVHAGEWTWVKLCWEALAPLEKDYEVFLHFVGPADRIVAVRHTHAGLGAFPTSAWQPGDAFCDRIRLPVYESAVAPAVYDIEVGLYDRERDERLVARNEDGNPVALAYFGRVKVWAAESPATTPPHRTDYLFADQVKLQGYGVEPASVRAGDSITLSLYWRAERRPEEDYNVFVHLLDGAGQLVSQADGPPQGGIYPTAWWEPGDELEDVRQIVLPADAGRGTHTLVVGLYRWPTMERVPVITEDGTYVPDAAIQLTEVRLDR